VRKSGGLLWAVKGTRRAELSDAHGFVVDGWTLGKLARGWRVGARSVLCKHCILMKVKRSACRNVVALHCLTSYAR